MAIRDSSLEVFLADLASRAATPGGGSASAVMGAIAASLSSMVCHLTIGKKKYADVAGELGEVLARADALRLRLIDAIAEDVEAFEAVMSAYGLPKVSEAEQQARHGAIQQALRLATDAPLACALLCREAIDLAVIVSEKGNVTVISDGGVAALAAHAALRSAALNVYVNAGVIEDRAFAADRLAGLETALDGAAAAVEATYAAVKQKLL